MSYLYFILASIIIIGLQVFYMSRGIPDWCLVWMILTLNIIMFIAGCFFIFLRADTWYIYLFFYTPFVIITSMFSNEYL